MTKIRWILRSGPKESAILFESRRNAFSIVFVTSFGSSARLVGLIIMNERMLVANGVLRCMFKETRTESATFS